MLSTLEVVKLSLLWAVHMLTYGLGGLFYFVVSTCVLLVLPHTPYILQCNASTLFTERSCVFSKQQELFMSLDVTSTIVKIQQFFRVIVQTGNQRDSLNKSVSLK